MLSSKRGIDAKSVPSRNLPEVHTAHAWLLEDCLHCRHALSAMAHCWKGDHSPQASDLNVPAFTPDYRPCVTGDVDWDLAGLNAENRSMDRAVLGTKFTELQEASRRDDGDISLSMI